MPKRTRQSHRGRKQGTELFVLVHVAFSAADRAVFTMLRLAILKPRKEVPLIVGKTTLDASPSLLLLHYLPAPSDLSQRARTLGGSKSYRLVITANIRVSRIIRGD
jgi:hypothetical protein